MANVQVLAPPYEVLTIYRHAVSVRQVLLRL